MKTAWYTLTEELKSDLYRRVLDYAVERCDTASVAVRPEIPLSARGAKGLQDLGPFLRKCLTADEWPGTRLMDATADVHYFAYNAESAAVLQKISTRLYQWIQPNLPEDLCLLRSNGEPWLVSTAHEGDAYFVLDETEMRDLFTVIPELWAISSRGQ